MTVLEDALLLELLINAPCSVAGLYGDLVWLCGLSSDAALRELPRTLELLEQQGLVSIEHVTAEGTVEPASAAGRSAAWSRYRSWLPGASRDELAIDEVGLWYRLTDAGRAMWTASSRSRGHRKWQLVENPMDAQLVIDAESEPVAHAALLGWLSRNPGTVIETERRSKTSGVRLRSGLVIDAGVRVECSYRRP
jgi:hypothetical protein